MFNRFYPLLVFARAILICKGRLDGDQLHVWNALTIVWLLPRPILMGIRPPLLLLVLAVVTGAAPPPDAAERFRTCETLSVFATRDGASSDGASEGTAQENHSPRGVSRVPRDYRRARRRHGESHSIDARKVWQENSENGRGMDPRRVLSRKF